MSSIDFNSGPAEVYVSQMRTFRKAGKQPHWRPAVNRAEKLLADEVSRYVDRSTFGYLPPSDLAPSPAQRVCEGCGSSDELRLIGSVYLKCGRVDKYRCRAC